MAQKNQIQTDTDIEKKEVVPHSPFYINLLIDTVNKNPTDKNIKKMQKTLNSFREQNMPSDEVGIGYMLDEFREPLSVDGDIGGKTKSAVRYFRRFGERERQRKLIDIMKQRRAPFFPEETVDEPKDKNIVIDRTKRPIIKY
jgi:hypothetical protein